MKERRRVGAGRKRTYVAAAGDAGGGRRGGDDVAGAERRRASHSHRHLEATGGRRRVTQRATSTWSDLDL